MRVKTDARRQDIINKAREVFRDMGYERASMSEIAARVGGSKATLYSYFKSKEELFVASLQGSAPIVQVFGPLLEPERTLGSIREFRDELDRFGLEFVKLSHMPNILAMRRNLTAMGYQSEAAQKAYVAGPQQSFKVVAAYLEQAMNKGYLRKADPWVAALHLLRLLNAEYVEEALMGTITNVTPKMIRDAVKRALEVWWRGYATELE